MRKYNSAFRLPLVAKLVPFFWMLLLVACAPGTLSSIQDPLPADVKPEPSTTIEVKTSPEVEISSTANKVDGFDCGKVNQVPVDECEALVALFNRSGGLNWADQSGWLVSNDICNWIGILCERGHIILIDLSYNELTGSLPPELGGLSRLRGLYVQGNRLSGAIPPELADLSALVTLDLAGNQLLGSLPAELGNLSNLQTLILFGNQISGPVPASFGKLGKLDVLNLSNNKLSGTIPKELGVLPNLKLLYLAHNGLAGSIPEAFAKLNELIELDLSYNQLSGDVPESFNRIDQRLLWGNEFDGTIIPNSQGLIIVDYNGVQFTADPSLARSIWPEVIAARPATEGGPFWEPTPEHIRFTFADPMISLERRRMGINLAAEAQIFVFPLAELAAIDPFIQARIETLRGLLAEKGPLPAAELPLLPLANSLQVLHAQARYLEFGDIQGLRFISEHSQDPLPFMLSTELFYTFQGLTNDGAYYVAAFFPISTAILPDRIEIDDWDVFIANYDPYLADTTAALDQLPPAEFSPDLTLLDAVVTSLRVDPTVNLNDGMEDGLSR